MNRLFWGLSFVLVDYELTVGTAVFEVFPDFLGFFLMLKGMEALSGRSRYFDRGRHLCFALLLGSGVLYGGALMNPQTMTKVWLWAAELICLTLTLLLLWWILRGFQQMELPCSQAKLLLPVLAVVQVLSRLLEWIPMVGDICHAAGLIISLCFLGVLWGIIRSKN